jgi:hypothetical protein
MNKPDLDGHGWDRYYHASPGMQNCGGCQRQAPPPFRWGVTDILTVQNALLLAFELVFEQDARIA